MFLKTTKIILSVFILCLLLRSDALAQIHKRAKFVVNGYVGGFRGLVQTREIDAEKLTHINYAFGNVQDSMAVLSNLRTDSTNFRNLNLLKKINPELKILISIGGWGWSENFSDAVLTPSSRKLFATTSVDIVKQYNLDGIDIDWEYPGIPGEEGNVYRPEDKQNYTLMFQEIRRQLDILEKDTQKEYQLTAAVGGSKSFIEHTEMEKVGEILDYIFIMTYDYSGPNGTAGHHTNLFPADKKGEGYSAHQSVSDYLSAGVPAGKIGLGAAFYGKATVVQTAAHNGLAQLRASNLTVAAGIGGGYTRLKDSLVNQQGYKGYWDRRAKAPYLFNKTDKVFVTYDDERSLRKKVKYIKKHGLAGIFFWEYFSDPKEYLLNIIHQKLP
jgi:chitinase